MLSLTLPALMTVLHSGCPPHLDLPACVQVCEADPQVHHHIVPLGYPLLVLALTAKAADNEVCMLHHHMLQEAQSKHV